MADKYSFVVIKYPGVHTAEEAQQVLRQLNKENAIKLKDSVAVYKNEHGEIKLHQTKDMGVGKGALEIGAAGLVVGLILGGPVAWALAGAVAGGVAGAFDTRIQDNVMKELGEGLGLDESALCLLIEDIDLDTVQTRMKSYDKIGEVVVKDLTSEHVAMLDKAAQNAQVADAVTQQLVEDKPPESKA